MVSTHKTVILLGMWPRFYKEDYFIIAHYLGTLLALIASLMGLPLLIALCLQEWESALDFFLSMGVAYTLAALLRLAKIRPPGINRRQALMVTTFIWVFASFIAAVPLYLSGHFISYIDALFEAVSGFTDTGVSLVQDLNHLSYSMNFWRHLLQIVGGQGIIVIMLGLGSLAQQSGAGLLYQAEGRNDMILPQLAHTTRFIVAVSSTFVGLGILASVFALLPSGISFFSALFHSVCLNFAAFATGGFSPMSSSMVYYHSFPLEVVMELVMLTGMFSFSLYFAMIMRGSGEFLRDIEVRTIALWLGVCVVIIALSMARDRQFSQLDTLIRRGVFVVISAGTNTGFSTMYTSQMAEVLSKGAFFAILLSMSMGGATNSTTGGIKAFRVAVVAKSIVRDVKRALTPDTAVVHSRYYHLGEQVLRAQESKNAMMIFLLFFVSYIAGSMLGVILGYPPLDALFESVSVTSNAGLTSGITSADMSILLKLSYILQMLIGRLEFLTVFAAFAALMASAQQYIRKNHNIPV